MTQYDRRIRVYGERREQIDTRRIADLIVRVARTPPSPNSEGNEPSADTGGGSIRTADKR